MSRVAEIVAADDAIRFADLSWNEVAKIASDRQTELIAVRCELDRVNAELVRLRRELTELTDLHRSK